MDRNSCVLKLLASGMVLALLANPSMAAQTGPKEGGPTGAAKTLEDLNKVTGTTPLQGALDGLLKDKDETKKLLNEATPLVKGNKVGLTYNAALVLALAAADQKDLSGAEVFFRVCMDKAAKLQSPDRLLQSYGGLIEILYDNKKYGESARVCRELLELKTDDGKPRTVLVPYVTKFGEVDYNEQEAFDTGKRLRPAVHKLLIQALSKQGKHEEALKLADNLVKASDHWLEHALKGWIHREAGQFTEAAKIYEDVIERANKDKTLEPEEREAYTERYRYVLSNIYVDLKQIDKAVGQLRDLLAKKPDDPGYNNDLGYIMADHDMKLDEAEKLIRNALELDRKRRKANPKLDPEDDFDNGAYLDSLGWVLFKQKKFKEARDVLLDAVKDKRAQHIEIFDHLGDVQFALGDREAALSAWRKGLEVVGEGQREAERKTAVEKKIEKHGK